MIISTTMWSNDFLKKWDFDQDGKNDSVYFEYTGGAHCCYNIRIKTSHDNKTWKFDDDMDGGYVMGVDGSQPDHFNIKNYDNDSAPEILMEVETYNGEYNPWSGHVLLDYRHGYFFKEHFDLYAYYRSLDTTIRCSGTSGVSGFYISRGTYVIETMVLHSSGLVDYYERPRGPAPWSNDYIGKWKLRNDSLFIVYTHQNYEDMPDANEPLEKPISITLLFRPDQCMFEVIGKTQERFFKE